MIVGALLLLALAAAAAACVTVIGCGAYLAADRECGLRSRITSGIIAVGGGMGLGGVVAAMLRTVTA